MEGALRYFQTFGGVVFGADDVVSPFFDDAIEGLEFVVQRVEGHRFVDELDTVIFEEGARFGDFAVFFFASRGDEGDWSPVLMAAERYDHSSFAVSDAFSVEGERVREGSLVVLEPLGEDFGKGLGVEEVHEVIEAIIAWHAEVGAAFDFYF